MTSWPLFLFSFLICTIVAHIPISITEDVHTLRPGLFGETRPIATCILLLLRFFLILDFVISRIID